MPTKKTSTTTNSYNPTSMGAFNAFTAGAQPALLDYMKDPLTASYFAAQMQMLMKASQQMGARNTNAIASNALMSGGANMPGFLQSGLARAGRQTSAMQSNAFLQALMQAESNRRGAVQQGLSYQPLQTGQTRVDKTSGLGTWLPAVAMGVLGAATGGLGLIPGLAGGFSGALGGATGMLGGNLGAFAGTNTGSGGGGGAPSFWSQPSNTWQGSGINTNYNFGLPWGTGFPSSFGGRP